MKKWIIALIVVVFAYCLYAQPGPIQPLITNLTQFVNQTAWRIFYSNTDGDITELALGTNGQYLKSNGATSAPSWATPAGSGDLLADGSVPMTSNWDIGNYDITLKSLTGDGTIEGATITEGGVAVYNDDEMDAFSELDTIVADKSLVNMADGATWLGVHTFGGGTTVIPWKVNTTAAPTVEGQAIWESDTDELTVGDGSVSVVIAAKTGVVFAFNLHDPDNTMDDIKMQFPRAVTITKVTAICTAGTNVIGRLYEVDGDSDDADAVGVEAGDWTFTTTETEDASFNNATFDAGDYIQWDTTSVSGSVTNFALTVEGYEL